MRKMKNKYGTEVNVISFFMTKGNMWEYFITDNKYTDDIVTAVVAGFEVEMGDVSLSELKPYIMVQSNDLSEAMPAPGWSWAD